MSREKKSQVDDITVLRRILDNSSDPSLTYLISKNDYALESVRRRLNRYFFTPQPRTQHHLTSSDSMEPRVTIHAKLPISPRFITPPPKLEQAVPLPEFELISHSISAPPVPSAEVSFFEEELFEVEKVDRTIPEFLEIIPKEREQESPRQDVAMQPVETSLSESNLPEWQPVDEEHVPEAIESPQTTMVAEIPEFEKVSIASKPEDRRESPIEFTPAEPDEVSTEKLTKKQERAAKKTLRKKEKEEKKLKKIEQQRLEKEQQDKQEIKRFEEEPQSLDQSEDEPSLEAERQDEDETPQIRVDYNNFKGIESIDEKTAELLYKNGYFSIENLKEATVDDLVQIRGIKRKLAKQMKKEIESYVTQSDISEFIPGKPKITKKKEKKRPADSSEWETSTSKEKTHPSHDMCTYKDYTLYKRETRKPDGKKATIHYFSKSKSGKGEPSPLPKGYRIALNKNTGVPYLKKKP